MILHVGLFQLRPRLDEAIDDAGGEGQHAALLRIVLDDLLRELQAARLLVQRDRQLHPPVHPRREVVAVVLADAAQLVLHLDAERLQQLRLADARQLQQMRRLHRSGRQDHLGVAPHLMRLAVLAILDADRALALQQDACGMGLGLDPQIGPGARRIEEGARRGPAPALLLRHLIVAEAFLPAVVVVADCAASPRPRRHR